jgi:hypothetical protein
LRWYTIGVSKIALHDEVIKAAWYPTVLTWGQEVGPYHYDAVLFPLMCFIVRTGLGEQTPIPEEQRANLGRGNVVL